MSVPLVSIVTPTLNQGAFIEQALLSVRAQTYPSVEHIVVDGGTTDATPEILRRYENTYPMSWISGSDRGMYDAINNGLAMAEGEIVAYLNSDDLYFPWTVDVVADTLARHDDVDFVFGHFLQIDETTGRRGLMFQMPFDLDYVRWAGFLAQPAVFSRRDVHEELNGFDISLRYIADCAYWMRARTSHRFLKVSEVLAVDREQGSSLRQTGAGALDRELAGVLSRYVTLEGDTHLNQMRRHRIRNALFRRGYGPGFTLQALLLRALRPRPWRHFLTGCRHQPHLGWIAQIPKIGWRYVDRVVKMPDTIGSVDGEA